MPLVASKPLSLSSPPVATLRRPVPECVIDPFALIIVCGVIEKSVAAICIEPAVLSSVFATSIVALLPDSVCAILPPALVKLFA
jgi:hypothetical protein